MIAEDPEFLAAIERELEACRVSRDNPVHQKLIAGRFSHQALRDWGRQQYIFHRAFPAALTRLARKKSDGPNGTDTFLDFARMAEAGTQTKPGRLQLWTSICGEWGLMPDELEKSSPLPATEVMIAIQLHIATESFCQGFVGLAIGVILEAADFGAERKEALRLHYGVSEDSLGYFTAWALPTKREDLLRVAAGSCPDRVAQADALRALRLVLRTRWAYFEAIGASAGL